MAKKYRDDIDYSKELQRTDLSSSERSRLEAERSAKIADKYGGIEPNMTGSDKKFSDVYTGSGGKVSTSSGSSSYGSSSGSSSRGSSSGSGSSDRGSPGIYGITVIPKAPERQQEGYAIRNRPDMGRRQDLAGQVAISGGYTVFYDDQGYATKAIKGKADYTPHQDINAGNGSYSQSGAWTDNETLTAEDNARINSLRQQAAAGLISWTQANQEANRIRSGYGYTIDSSGMVTDLLAKSTVDQRRQNWGLETQVPDEFQSNFLDLLNAAKGQDAAPSADLLEQVMAGGQGVGGPLGGSFGFEGAPEYEGSKWDEVLNTLAQRLVDMNYEDWTKGGQYAALAQRYSHNGRMSMQDVLGQIASRTGGLASSYATSTAQQQYNDYMAKLEEAAMEMYGAERGDLLENAQLARQFSQEDYDRYVDRYNQWADNRDFAYGAYRDSLADQQRADELAYERQLHETESERAQAEAMAENMAAAGDFSGYKALGYTDQQIAVLRAAYEAANAPRAVGGRSRSGGSGDDGGSGDGGSAYALYLAARESGDDPEHYVKENYKNYGLTKQPGGYGDWEESLPEQISSDGFQSFLSRLNISLSEAPLASVDAMTAKLWPVLTEEQRRQVQHVYDHYGYSYSYGA